MTVISSRPELPHSELSNDSDLSSDNQSVGGRLGFPDWRKCLWLLPLLVLPVVWLVRSPGNEAQEIAPAQVLPVETSVLQGADSYSVARAYTGEIVARRSSDLGFEQAGTVVVLLAEEGDVVAAGAPLARLDTRDLEAQKRQLAAQKRQFLAQLQELETGPRREDIAAAEAAVSDLRHQLALAQLQAERRASLYAQGAVSKEELDERQFGADAIADRLQQAQSQLEELRNGTRAEQLAAQAAQVEQIDARIHAIDIALDKSVLVAPFAGKVSIRDIDEGTVVGGGQRVMKLVENAALEARVGVPESVASDLALGSRQSIQVADQTYPATVSARLPEVDEVSQTVTVVLALEALEAAEAVENSRPENALTIGATARLILTESQDESGYWVPSTALVAGDRGLWSVYVLMTADESQSEAYRVARRDVEVLHTEGEQAFVRGLVGERDRVITSGTHRIVSDQLVKPSGE